MCTHTHTRTRACTFVHLAVPSNLNHTEVTWEVLHRVVSLNDPPPRGVGPQCSWNVPLSGPCGVVPSEGDNVFWTTNTRTRTVCQSPEVVQNIVYIVYIENGSIKEGTQKVCTYICTECCFSRFPGMRKSKWVVLCTILYCIGCSDRVTAVHSSPAQGEVYLRLGCSNAASPLTTAVVSVLHTRAPAKAGAPQAQFD